MKITIQNVQVLFGRDTLEKPEALFLRNEAGLFDLDFYIIKVYKSYRTFSLLAIYSYREVQSYIKILDKTFVFEGVEWKSE